MKSNSRNTAVAAFIAIVACGALIALAAWMRIQAHLGEAAFVSCVGIAVVMGFCIYRGHDVTELAFSKSASVKLKRAEEISDQVSILAEQMLLLFEPVDLDDKPFDEKEHRRFMEETMSKIRSLTKR